MNVSDIAGPLLPSSRPKLVVFDCDGTLVDSQHAICAAMAHACRTHGVPAPADAAMRRTVGLPLEQAIALAMPDHAPDDHARLTVYFREAWVDMRDARLHEEPLFPGMLAALDAFAAAGVPLGVATGKPRRGLDATLERHGLAHRFRVLKTADDGPGKPHPAILLDALAETSVAASEAVMIGDTSYDMAMARAAGVRAVGVGWGYHAAAELLASGAERVVMECAELPPAVLGGRGRIAS